jgi:hypothetical protein
VKLDLRYLGASGLERKGDDLALHFSPNLARPATFFDGEVKSPVRFREAISALHDVVISDLRREKKDRSAWKGYKADEARRERELRATIAQQAEIAHLAKKKSAAPPNLEGDFRRLHRRYWSARVQWANELMRSDPDLFRHLVPCDPVVTVAPDVVSFECFSKDESSYACLSVERDGFANAGDAALGTTNVDYSMALYDHFQELRTYRPTRLLVDPSGFAVDVHGQAEVREEKIDLPATWLRGFGQLSAAMALPSRKVELSVDVVYSMLTLLARRLDVKGKGRALVFHLTPGAPPEVVVEPWGVRLESRGAAYEGFASSAATAEAAPVASPYRAAPARASVTTEVVKVWGRRRLFALARLLPLVSKIEVRLLGSGLPSVWIAHAGDMRLVLALSGWTANDWAGGANLDLLAGDLREDDAITARLASTLEQQRVASLGELAVKAGGSDAQVLGGLFKLSKQGQVVYDYAAERFRYRPILPVPLADGVLGPEPDEPREGKRMAREKLVVIEEQTVIAAGRVHVRARVTSGLDKHALGTACEAIFSSEGLSKAKCDCSYFYKHKLRAGPCRHLLALKLTFVVPDTSAGVTGDVATAAKPAAKADVFTLAREVAASLEARATTERRDAQALLVEAWDASSARIQAAKSWNDAVALAPRAGELLANGFVAPPLVSRETGLHPSVLAEIGKIAHQLGASPSAVLNLAWLLHAKKGGR